VAKPGDVLGLDLDLLDDNPFQPRTSMDEAKLAELAASILEAGLLQPIAVRPAGPGRYQVVAGHRRVAAFKKLRAEAKSDAARRQYQLIRAHVVAAVSDKEMAVAAYVENAQRDNLTPVEEAAALARIKELGNFANAKELATAVGQAEQRVRRLMRLNVGPRCVKEGVTTGLLVSTGSGDNAKRERRRLDLMAGLEFVRLYEYVASKKPKDAEERTRSAIGRALADGWNFRRIQDYVEGVISGRTTAAGGEADAKPAALVTRTAERFVLATGRLDSAALEQLANARDEVRAVLADLEARVQKAAQPPAPIAEVSAMS
jgi:ParB/RepB/Spo0J family partition protein